MPIRIQTLSVLVQPSGLRPDMTFGARIEAFQESVARRSQQSLAFDPDDIGQYQVGQTRRVANKEIPVDADSLDLYQQMITPGTVELLHIPGSKVPGPSVDPRYGWLPFKQVGHVAVRVEDVVYHMTGNGFKQQTLGETTYGRYRNYRTMGKVFTLAAGELKRFKTAMDRQAARSDPYRFMDRSCATSLWDAAQEAGLLSAKAVANSNPGRLDPSLVGRLLFGREPDLRTVYNSEQGPTRFGLGVRTAANRAIIYPPVLSMLAVGGLNALSNRFTKNLFRKADARASVLRRSGTGPTATQPIQGYRLGGGEGLVEIGKLRILLSEAAVAPNDPTDAMVFAKLRASGASEGEAPLGLEYVLDQSEGQPLPAAVMARMEGLLGVDLRDVRIHTGEAAQSATAMVGAEAFTLGDDIYFGQGNWDPTSPAGLALLGHELTHVAQEHGGAPTLQIEAVQPSLGERVQAMGEEIRARGMSIASPYDRFEVQAHKNERVIQRALSGFSGWDSISGAGPSYMALAAGGKMAAPYRKRLGGDGASLDPEWLHGLIRRGDAAEALGALNSEDLVALLGPGQVLESSVRAQLEAALGYDLGDVRVHTGLEAERLAASLEAHAFTIGRHVIMGEGSWQTDTPEGLGLLAHEATHVVQAAQGRLHQPDTPGRLDRLEAEAYGLEASFVAEARSRRDAAYTRPNMLVREEPVVGGSSIPASPAGTAPPEPQPRLIDLQPSAAEFPLLRKDRRVTIDSVQEVIDLYQIPLGREEFLEDCKGRLLDLLREEIELENERRETLSWNPYLPQA